MRCLLLLLWICMCPRSEAQQAHTDSTKLVHVFDRTLRVPSSFVQVITDTGWCGAGYITDGIDTLTYSRCMAIMPMLELMIEPYCSPYGDTAACAAERARVRAQNDSARADDPRIGKYYFSYEHGDGCWYERYSPMHGVVGYFAVEISAESGSCESFLLSTTNIDLERQALWRGVLESLSR